MFAASMQLPKPVGDYSTSAQQSAAPASAVVAPSANQPPPYGSRHGFVPRAAADFADGGAFPEIHVLQYPRGMGAPHSNTYAAEKSIMSASSYVRAA